MKYPAQIFDYSQYLFQTTGFNDHQLHCVIEYKDKINASLLKKAIYLLLQTVPILSRVYVNRSGNSYWEAVDPAKWNDLFTIVYKETDFEQFTFSKTDEETGPQIKVCLLKAKQDSVSIIMNHMVTDGGGFKQCLYLLSDLYSNLVANPQYIPDTIIDGDRSFQEITRGLRFPAKIRILLGNRKENNRRGNDKFPVSKEEDITPFILKHTIIPECYHKIRKYCEKNKVTMNDVLFTAYIRVLSRILHCNGKAMGIPIMIDMRRYLEDKSLHSLTNLTSMVMITVAVSPEENFESTLAKVHAKMLSKKDHFLGMNSFLKLDLLFRFLNPGFSYQILEKSLKSPYICMTNIGIIDESKLHFQDCTIDNVFVCGSIKYRPHFQMAVSTYQDKMTFTVNLYGSKEDQENVYRFFRLMDKELKNLE
jgi:Uncharacterized protein containing a NRPS condensation (elongation) domain